MSRRFLLLFTLPILLFGCGAREEAQQSTTTQTASSPERTDYESTAEHRLSELGARIDSLKADLDHASAETKAAIQSEIDELEVKRQDAERKLEELRAASADRWEEVKGQMASMLDDLDQRFDRMRAKLRDG